MTTVHAPTVFQVGASVGAGLIIASERTEESAAVIVVSDEPPGTMAETEDKPIAYTVLSRTRLANLACMLAVMSEHVGVPADYDAAAARTRCEADLAAAQDASSPK